MRADRAAVPFVLLAIASLGITGCPTSSNIGDAGDAGDGGDAGPIDFIEDAGLDRATLGTGWSCSTFVSGGDLWLRTYSLGAEKFDFRIGAGGALSEVRESVTTTPLLPSTGNTTADVSQWRAWGDGIQRKVDAGDPRWNVVQAGNQMGAFSPTIDAGESISGADCEIWVWSTPLDQWTPRMSTQVGGAISALTHYRVFGTGELMIRRTLLIGEAGPADAGQDGGIPDSGIPIDPLRIEAWAPFNATTFDTLAFAVTDSGIPLQGTAAGLSFDAGFADVANTSGYVIAYVGSAPSTNLALAVLYGQQEPCEYHANICDPAPNPVDDPQPDGGINSVPAFVLTGAQAASWLAVAPAMTFPHLDAGTLIEQYLIVIPSKMLDATLATEANTQVSLIPPPRVLVAGSNLTDDYVQLLQTLTTNLDASGSRTDQLGSFVQ